MKPPQSQSNDAHPTENATEVHTRVLKDIFHLMDMVKVPKHHGVAKEFNARFRDTIFVVDEEDRRRVERYLEGQDVTFQQMQG